MKHDAFGLIITVAAPVAIIIMVLSSQLIYQTIKVACCVRPRMFYTNCKIICWANLKSNTVNSGLKPADLQLVMTLLAKNLESCLGISSIIPLVPQEDLGWTGQRQIKLT